MTPEKNIVLVAHENKKQDFLEGAKFNIPAACNRATADFMIWSSPMTEEYRRIVLNYEAYRQLLKEM